LATRPAKDEPEKDPDSKVFRLSEKVSFMHELPPVWQAPSGILACRAWIQKAAKKAANDSLSTLGLQY